MGIKAVFLDYYGTLVHEDDDVLPQVCKQIQTHSPLDCQLSDIGSYWWTVFTNLFKNSYGEQFLTQRRIAVQSLAQTIDHFKAGCDAEDIIRIQFEHWVKPTLFEDTKPFLAAIKDVPVYILSNIDTQDIMAATTYHDLKVTSILTSESVRSYKPRPELFLEALRLSGVHPSEALHIGDSLTSDVYGAQQLGINAVWLNRQCKPLPAQDMPDYSCQNLLEAARLIGLLKG